MCYATGKLRTISEITLPLYCPKYTLTLLQPLNTGIPPYQCVLINYVLFSVYLQSTSFRVTHNHHYSPDTEFIFRVRAINSAGAGPPSEISEPVVAIDRRQSIRSISTLGDSESLDYSEYSDYPESEYDPDLDGESRSQTTMIIFVTSFGDDQMRSVFFQQIMMNGKVSKSL